MIDSSIICRPTTDTFVRFGIVLLAFFGFGLYFFYDGSVGYRKANEVYFSYQAFARLGAEASKGGAWGTAGKPLIEAEQVGGEWMVEGRYPLPTDCEAAAQRAGGVGTIVLWAIFNQIA